MAANPVIRLNVLAKDVVNARQIAEATGKMAYIGIMVKNFATVDSAIQAVEEYQQAGIPVSVGLGAGDPTQWRKVAEVAVRTRPVHVNQVFPAAGYTIGALESAGISGTIVNALVAPSGVPGKVSILTGPVSRGYREVVSCDAAAAMLQEIGVKSVKFYPIEGDKRLDEVAAMVKAAVRQGITIFEPTGGINARSVHSVVATCAENGAQTIIPHIYTAFVDKATGLTSADDVAALLHSLAR
jgi:conserved hypothetical protein EF_0839/AHA_3917